MHPLQEKFQITVPARGDGGEGNWVSADSQRCLNGMGQDIKGNFTPPGMEFGNQERAEFNNMPLVTSGESDVSRDTNAQALVNGFTRRQMKGSDDQYTGEHVDHFYGDAGGFVERNNYLDRE